MVKEIISKAGKLHFRRWRILELPKLRVYLHYIAEKDHDAHEHDHPWHFCSLILKGGYIESSMGKMTTVRPGSILKRHHYIPHKIHDLIAPTWTLVIAWGPYKKWGYSAEGGWIDHETYRKLKNEGAFQK